MKGSLQSAENKVKLYEEIISGIKNQLTLFMCYMKL